MKSWLDNASISEMTAKTLAEVLLSSPQFISNAMSDANLSKYVEYVLPHYDELSKKPVKKVKKKVKKIN